MFQMFFCFWVAEAFVMTCPPKRRMVLRHSFVSESVAPVAEELTNENLVRIVREECSDEEVNELVWKCLGYRRQGDKFVNDEVFPKWREKYPDPPDLVGVTRTYSKSVDEPVLRANQALVASIPMKYKAGIKEHLRKVGWTGFMLEGLTPNKTRRAQCTNWLLFYREALFGLSLEDLRQQKQRDVDQENQRLREQGQSLRVATGVETKNQTTTDDIQIKSS